MKPEITDAMTRLRKHFFVKDSEAVGFAGVAVIKSNIELDTSTDRVIEIIATTNAMDLDDQIVDPAGVDWSYFNAANQKKVFQDHNYDSQSNVGITRSISPYLESGVQVGWKMRIHIFRNLKCPYADDIWEKCKQGGPPGGSIGFIPKIVRPLTPAEQKRWPGAESIVTEWKALEFSLTNLPCNVKCQTISATEGKTAPTVLVIDNPPTVVEC